MLSLSILGTLGAIGAIAKWVIPAVFGIIGISKVSKATGGIKKFLNNSVTSLGEGISNVTQNAGSHLESFMNQTTGAALTGAQVQANEFSAEEAQKQREWQAEMDSTRYQRTVADMRGAGVNPALAMSNGASASAPSGASASSVSPSASGNLGELLSILRLPLELKRIKAEMRLMDADANLRGSQARATDAEAGLTEKRITAFDALTQSQLDDVYSAISRRDVQNKLDAQGINESMAREALQLQQAIQTAIDNETRSELNSLAVKYREAQIALANAQVGETNAQTHKLYKDCELIMAQIMELEERSILHAANANYLNEAARNLMVQHNILEFDERTKEFQVNHQKAQFWIDAGAKVVGAAAGVVTAGAAVGAAGRLARSARSVSSYGAERFNSQYSQLYPYD